jgi:hypothetical protein
LYDITPGQTSRSQALNRLKALPYALWDEQMPGGFWINGVTGKGIYATINGLSYHDTVLQLLTEDEKPVLSLRQFVDAGCKPSRIYRVNATGPNAVILLLVFGQYGQIIAVVDGYFSVHADSPIASLWLLPARYSESYLGDIRMIQHFDDEIPWLGYASVEDYWALEPIN